MKKRWISLLLVFVMMLSLLPFGVLADTETPGVVPGPGSDDSGMNQTGGEPGAEVFPGGTGTWEQGPKGNRDVAVIVYGQAVSRAIAGKNGAVTTFINALKNSLQGILAGGEPIPDVEMYLYNNRKEFYKLTPNAVKDAAFLSSFRMKGDGIGKVASKLFKWLEDGFGWLVSGVDTPGDFYKIYGVKDDDGVPLLYRGI